MLDAAYTVLAKVHIDADLHLDTPSGGRIRISNGEAQDIRVDCSDEQALWDAFDLASTLGLVEVNYRSLKQLRNPLLQTLEIVVGDRTLLVWPADKLPHIKSLRGVLGLLRNRG